MAFGALVILLSNDPEMPEMTASFPRKLGVLLILLSILLLVFSLVGKKNQKNGNGGKKAEGDKPMRLPVLYCMILMLIYCLIIEIIGYIASTIFLVAGTIYVLGNRNLVVIFSVALGITFFIFVMFSKLFAIALPTGSLWG